MIVKASELWHEGVKRKSGRYPWGSGEDPYQHEAWYQGTYASFVAQEHELKAKGLSDVNIAKEMGITTTVLRQRRTIANEEMKAARASQAYRLKTEKGYSNEAIGQILGVTEGTVRNLLKKGLEVKQSEVMNTSQVLKEAVDKYGYLDVGRGTNSQLGVSETNMKAALQYLEDQGYKRINVQVDQLGTEYKTTVNVLAPPGTTYRDVVANKEKIAPVTGKKSYDNGQTFLGLKEYPESIDPSRVAVRFGDEGGTEMDGTILLRRGVEDISLGGANYAQVRILVGEDRYLKGMAMYSDDLPKGVDLLFNTNKSRADCGGDKMKALKGIKGPEDDDFFNEGEIPNPFGATVAQRHYIGKDGKDHLSPINIVHEQGEWGTWKKNIASQMLSKQPVSLAKEQLDKQYANKKAEYDEIMSLTNPTVRKALLKDFSDSCDGNAVDLKAAAFPGQQSHVLLPFPSISDKEIYAPNYKDGDRVVLIRFPHGGIFEIPELTVNNKNPDAKKALGNAPDAVGINSKVAERLSGADFDGDNVLVVPNNEGKIKTASPLKGLKDFDPKQYYPAYEGMTKVGAKTDGFNKGLEMGKVSNLITDMTIKGAEPDEIAAAVRHSMVVIDAEKHNLNWKQSYIDNNIEALTAKYQGRNEKTGQLRGASTIISRAKSPVMIPQRKQNYHIDKETGKKIYEETGETYTSKTGKVKPRMTKTTKMGYAEDAMDLVSDKRAPVELEYATFANKMKALGNEARKEMMNTPNQKYDPAAKKTYAKEVESLDEQLRVAKSNSAFERQAQLLGNSIVAAKKRANPDMDFDELKRVKGQAIVTARAKVGASKTRIVPTKREWEAIQAGAISENKLQQIIAHTDMDVLKQLAIPRVSNTAYVTASEKVRIKAMVANGFTQSQIAQQLGMSTSTVNAIVNS